MLDDIVDLLACPHCGAALGQERGCLRCAGNHVFDIAKQGYVSLLSGRSRIAGDSAAMVAARAAFLGAGHFAPITERVAEAVPADSGGVLDLGAGTGHHLAGVLDRHPHRTGIAMDVSKYACRRAAKAHPRIGAVVADAWQRLPVRGAAVSVVLDVFAPRNAEEMHRVLGPGGHLVVVIPRTGHLQELVSALGLLSVDERKQQRLDLRLGNRFEPVRAHPVDFTMTLDSEEVAAVVSMGPSAWHSSEETLRTRIAALPNPTEITAAVTVSVLRAL